MNTRHSLTGPELKAIRRKAALSQIEMAELVGCSRHNVSYHETKRRPLQAREYRWGCLARMLKVLAVEILPNYANTTRARGDGVLQFRDRQQEALDRQIETRLELLKEKLASKRARQRVRCGARTRKGTACRNKAEPGKWRCKFHGGMSTGPRTPEGRVRIAEAQRKRWAAYRARAELS